MLRDYEQLFVILLMSVFTLKKFDGGWFVEDLSELVCICVLIKCCSYFYVMK